MRPKHNRVLQLTLLSCAALFPVIAGSVAWTLTRVSPTEVAAYHKLTTKDGKTQTTPYSSKQQRLKVQKDVLFAQGQDRLQLRLNAEDSQLVLDHDKDTEIIEHMNGVTCMMQEQVYWVLPDGREATLQSNGKLLIRNADPEEEISWLPKEAKGLKPMQVIRYLEADTASNHYKKDLFVAENVRISSYAVPGHHLVDKIDTKKPLMKGTAQAVEFSLSGRDLNFKAHQLKATLFSLPGRSS